MTLFKIAGVFIALLFVSGVAAQDSLPFTPESGSKQSEVHEPWIGPAAGFVPSNNALRFSVLSGNLLLNRAGGYVTIEKGLDSSYFTNIYGITVTASRHIYFWGGVDVFTRRGIFHSFKGARKEMGIGIMPWKGLMVNTGWSKSVGFTFSFGWKLPLFTGKDTGNALTP